MYPYRGYLSDIIKKNSVMLYPCRDTLLCLASGKCAFSYYNSIVINMLLRAVHH